MTLLRTIVILVGGLVLLLCVVILRAETTRIHHSIAQAEREAEQLRQRVREEELRLARERNPMILHERMRDALEALEEKQDEKKAAAPPTPAKTSAAKEPRPKPAEKTERPKTRRTTKPRRP